MDNFNTEQERLAYLDALLSDLENTPKPITDTQLSIIENLLQYAIIDPDEMELISRQMFRYDYAEAEAMIKRLQLNQIDPISSGKNYSQTDILNKLNKIK